MALKYHKIVVGDLETNCYIVLDDARKTVLIIDPGAQTARITEVLQEQKLQPTEIVLTHSHYDHIGAAKELKDKYSIPISIHKLDADNLRNPAANFSSMFEEQIRFQADIKLEEGDEWIIGRDRLKVIHTPGHSEGSISLATDGLLFSGDTVFKFGIGRTDLPGGDYAKLRESISKLLEYPDSTEVLPGHGPSTTIGRERKFLMEI